MSIHLIIKNDNCPKQGLGWGEKFNEKGNMKQTIL